MSVELYQWLQSQQAQELVTRLGEVRQITPQLVEQLRKILSPQQSRLVLQLAQLRNKAREKFSHADSMYFTPVGLEQATDELTARYKAQRFQQDVPVLDLCCGIGGDLLALAQRGPAVGVDADPVTALVAEANLRAALPPDRAQHSRVVCIEVERLQEAAIRLDQFYAWHIDPDRRSGPKRASQPEYYRPGLHTIENLLKRNPNAAVKLAPAARVPKHWQREAELEWISQRRTCRQQVAWFGNLAERPGRSRATIILNRHLEEKPQIRIVEQQPSVELAVAPAVKQFLYDPDPAVLAADLLASLATELGLEGLGNVGGYLTGDRLIKDPAVSTFEVLQVLPFDRSRLKAALKKFRYRQLEIKKRAVDVDLEQLRRMLPQTSSTKEAEEALTVIIARQDRNVIAAICRRV